MEDEMKIDVTELGEIEDRNEIKFDVAELEEIEMRNGREFDYVRLSTADMNGISRTSVVPRRHLLKTLTEGFSACSGLLTINPRAELVMQKELEKLGNCELVACKQTIHNCPWVELSEQKGCRNKDDWLVGEVICEMKWPLNYRGGCFMQASPRFALRKQLHKMQELGLTLMSAFEIEYTLFNSHDLKPVFNKKDANATLVHSKFEKYLYTIENNCKKAGLDISALRIEHGEGQFELVMEPKFGVKTSDDLFTMKEAIKEMSASMGYMASFMTLPASELSGNGFHLNLSLWTHSSDGRFVNVFYDPNDPEHLSSTFRHFLAGLIKHAKALTAFCSPTVNCYRRLHSFLVPHKINWDTDNRTAAFRVKTEGECSSYLENRLPSSACNPYLATAATLAAGLDGLVHKLPLPQKFCVPLDSSKTVQEDDGNDCLPYSLEDALEELEKNQVMKEGLGEELVRWFVKLKRESEIDLVKGFNETDKWKKEKELYFEFI